MLRKTIISWAPLNVAFFGIGMDQFLDPLIHMGSHLIPPQLQESDQTIISGLKKQVRFFRCWNITLGVLAGPAIAGYLARYSPARRLLRQKIMIYSSLMALPPIVTLGIVLRQSRQRATFEKEETNNGGCTFVLLIYVIFQFFMSLAPSALQCQCLGRWRAQNLCRKNN